MVVDNDATVLRGRDVMRPEEADTPARQLYFACMLAYIDQGDREKHQSALLVRLEVLMAALELPMAKGACVRFAGKVANGQFYAALADCRWLINYETEILARASVAV
jgi:flagellar protein FlbT